MRWLRVIILGILVGLLQVGLMGSWRITAVVPNLVLVTLVAQTIWGRASEALLFAVLTGTIIDLASAGRFGLATSTLVLLSLALIALYQLGLDGRPLVVCLGLVAAATLAWGVIHVLAIGVSDLVTLAAWRVMIVEILVNVVLALPIGERVIRGARTV